MTTSISTDLTPLSTDQRLQRIREAQRAKNIAAGIITPSIIDGVGHAVGYTRVSTSMQAEEGNSLEAQQQQIQEYCTRKGLILDKIYTDAGISGGDRDRPELNKMLAALIPGMKVISISINRMARNTEHLLNIKNLIHEKKCYMVIIDQSIDTANDTSELLITILAAVAQEERTNTKAKISSVMQNMSREGKLRGKPRFGWKVEKGELIKDETEQDIICTIGDWIKEDPKITLTAIAKRLTDGGITIRKSSKIYPTTVKNIIEANKLR